MDFPAHPFWDFSLALYRKPGVAAACLRLQDGPGLDVNLLLYACWTAANGAGLAAPQIGVSRRVVIFGYQHNPRYPDAPPVPETVLINPEITPLGDAREDGWEGCLSVPGMRGRVPRFSEIRYRGYDQYGELIDRQVTGFHARVVQHECDHLDGILYPQRIEDMRYFGFLDTLSEQDLIELQPCDDES